MEAHYTKAGQDQITWVFSSDVKFKFTYTKTFNTDIIYANEII